MEIEKYIEIPFKDRGRDFEGCDCYGLARLFLENELNKTLPDFLSYDSAGDIDNIKQLIDTNRPLVAGKHKEVPEFGDIAIFRFYGAPTHIGVYVGQGRVLHVLRGSNSVCEAYDRGRLKGRLEGFYEVE